MAHDLVNNIKVASALNGATITTGTTNGLVIDTAGFDSHVFVVSNSAYTDGTFTLTVRESEASDLSGATALPAAKYQNTVTTITSANQRRKIGVIPTKRYIGLVVTAASAATGSHFSASVVQSNASDKPVA